MPTDRNSKDNENSNNYNTSNMSRDRDWDNESNPFVAFRRFADEQVSAVLQSITGLPSTLATPQSGHWTIFAEDHGYKNMSFRQQDRGANVEERNYTQNQNAENSGCERDHTPSNNDSTNTRRPFSRHRPLQSLEDDTWHSQDWPSKPSDFFGLDSLFDRLEHHFLPFSSRTFHPNSRFFFPDMFEDSNSPTWPLTYIMFSPYSPLHLERQAQYRAQTDRDVFSTLMSSLSSESASESAEPHWREAFEDLLRIENGKPMVDRNSVTTAKPENGTDWLHSLIKRGSLGDRWKFVYGNRDQPWSSITYSSSRDDDYANEEKSAFNTMEQKAKTELDHYERIMHDLRAQNHRQTEVDQHESLLNRNQEGTSLSEGEYEQGHEDTETWLDLVSGGNRKSVPEMPPEATSESGSSRVISTMARTERVRLSDGSIQTKKVQTKRFADGREETNESVEVSHAHPENDDRVEPGGQPRNGWFWKD